MPDILGKNFEHNALEADIERLNREVGENRALPEYKDFSGKELVKQALKPMIQEVSVQASQPTAVQKSDPQDAVLPAYLKDVSPEIKLRIERLVDEVFHGGLKKAVSDAKTAGFLIEDAFHDILTDKFYEEMRSRGMLK